MFLSSSSPRKLLAGILIVTLAASGILGIQNVSAEFADVPPPGSPGACFMKLDGVDGESSDSRHRGEIDVLSWSWGESNLSTGATGGGGGGGGAGKVSMQDFHFTKTIDKSSPKLFLLTATGEHIKKATLTCKKAGEGQETEYLRWELENVLVSSFQTGASGDSKPLESLSLNFSKIEFTYVPQKADGSLDAAVKAGYDVKANKKI